MPVVALDLIESTTRDALVAHGANAEVAASVANAVRVAEARGNKICGLYYLESYCVQLTTGRVQGDVVPEVSTPRPGVVRVDGKLGFAQPAFAAGLGQAIDAARDNGICGYSLEHVHTATSVAYFTERLALAGLIAIGCTNASPRVAPPGGSAALLGTNPMAMSVPDGTGGIAMQFDFATSAVALGTITRAKAAGQSIELGWAVDAEGQPTTDPAAALEGSLQSAGGYKGWGLGLMVEILAAGLTGGRRSVDVPPLKTPEGAPHDLGLFCIVIDPDGWDARNLVAQLEALADDVADQPGARVPGASLADPTDVEIEDDVWQMVLGLAGRAAGR
ncbi:MAG: Ldh family oxidoreductase [Actinomycetota bacterium]